jgi:hypothetical protein
MESSPQKIVTVVWIAALLMNTVFGTAVLTSMFTEAEIIGKVALIGFVFAAIFTLPLIVVLFISLKTFIRLEISGLKLFGFFFITGNVLTAVSFFVFTYSSMSEFLPFASLYLVATVSGSLAMLLEREAILNIRTGKEEYLFPTASSETDNKSTTNK